MPLVKIFKCIQVNIEKWHDQNGVWPLLDLDFFLFVCWKKREKKGNIHLYVSFRPKKEYIYVYRYMYVCVCVCV